MLEFNIDGTLKSTFDAGDAYQRVAGSGATSYGLGQSNDPLTPGAINPLSEDTLISPWDEADQTSSVERIQRHSALPQGHNAQPTQRGVNPGSDNDALTGTAESMNDLGQRLSVQTPIDQLTGGNPDGRAISSAQQVAPTDPLNLDQTNCIGLNTAPQQLDPLTGDAEDAIGFIPMPGIFDIDPEFLSHLGERAEVNNLLAEERFDRDQSAGTETHYNFTWGSGFSAHEGSGYDITDSKNNAADIGTVAYRDDKEVIGTIGYGSGRNRDSNDYFSFYAGKAGTYDLSLSNLGANVGLALYNDSGSLVSWSNNSGTQDENISTFLNEGHYTSRIYSYNTSFWNNNGATAFNFNISRQADCFEQIVETWIDDSSVKNAALNSIKYDGDFGRNDIIGILKSAGDYGSVTNTELTDLRQFHNIFSGTMRPDLAVLSEKVVFHDDSNAWYTGSDSIVTDLGDLEAGSSTQDLNLLIGKHMLGLDRPMAAGEYTQARGSLFVDGVSADDVDQGGVGSCYFLSALAGTANDKAAMIQDMFTDNGDGTYSVRFYTNGKVDYVTVDSMMATSATDRYLYANSGGDNGVQNEVADNNELWVALAEKAYAQVNESGRISQNGRNSYAGISGGNSATAITHITGLSATSEAVNLTGINGVSNAELINYVNSDRVVTVRGFNGLATGSGSGPTNISSGVQGHAYSIVGYDAATGRFDIRNPWDTQHLSLTHRQLRQLGADIRYSLS